MRGREQHSPRRTAASARDGNNARTGGSRRVVAPCTHRQQLRGLDVAHLESTAMAVTTATSREHEDGDGGGDCEDVTMEGGSHRSLGDRVLRGRRGWGAVVVMPHV